MNSLNKNPKRTNMNAFRSKKNQIVSNEQTRTKILIAFVVQRTRRANTSEQERFSLAITKTIQIIFLQTNKDEHRSKPNAKEYKTSEHEPNIRIRLEVYFLLFSSIFAFI